jgi:hypothetical protein
MRDYGRASLWASLGLGAAAVLVCAVALTTCRGHAPDGAAGGVSKVQSAVSIRPLDDPANPYRDKYGPGDAWIYEHAGAPAWDGAMADWPADWHTLEAFVDSQGWLIPTSVVRRNREEVLVDRSRDCRNTYAVEYLANGVMPRELFEAHKCSQFSVWADYYMPVPQWLAVGPPRGAMLYTNGDVITVGLLGSGEILVPRGEKGEGCCGGSSDWPLCRYDRNGNLICTTNYTWLNLYMDNLESGDRPEGHMRQTDQWYFIFRDDTGVILSVYDYDGTKLPGTDEPPSRDVHPFVLLNPDQIQHLYEAQQARKVG